MSTRVWLFKIMRLQRPACIALFGVLLAGCDEVQRIGDRARPATPHERYEQSLQRAGLDQTVLGRAWLRAARHAIAVPVSISLPYTEATYFPAEEARASAYRVVARRGQRLIVNVQSAAGSGAGVFVDLFALAHDGMLHSVEAARLDTGSLSLSRDGDTDSSYVVRIQPELLESARVTVNVRVEPLLSFPLPGAGNRNVQSFWGAARDGGRRQHQGVDIFAPRGTPVLAVAPGVISHVGTSRLGGNVVFLRDAQRGQNIYYAHLDQQLVRNGQRVDPGDTIGTVGTTGNARGGVPHLHFGIYRRGQGAIDPFHFIRREELVAVEVRADTSLFGTRARNRMAAVDVRAGPNAKSPSTARLDRDAPFDIAGASGDWFHIRTATGIAGYIAARSVVPATQAIRVVSARTGDIVRERPDSLAVVMDSLTAGAELSVLGTLDGFLLVRTPGGNTGWIAGRNNGSQ